MENNVAFTVKGSGNLYCLSAGRTLINFIEFDINAFYRECQSFAERCARTREWDEKYQLMIKDLLRSCHPYFAACYNTVFDKIVLDCVIDILCRMEGIGLEALWARNISAEDSLGQVVFARISDYKTGHAVNQWGNLQRMQKYAEKKARYIFSAPAEDPVEYDVRAMYFDLAYSTAAQMAGCPQDNAPAIRCTPTGLLSAAPEMFSPVSSLAASMIGTMPDIGRLLDPRNKSDCLRELTDGMVCVELMRLPMPDKLEMISVSKKLRELPRRTYVPESLKAVIDLEIDEMLERKLVLELIPGINRFELRPMYRPAPPAEEVFEGQQTLFDELSDNTPAEALDETEESSAEPDAETEQELESDAEDIPAFEPSKLYAAIEPEPEGETEEKAEPEPENASEAEAEPELPDKLTDSEAMTDELQEEAQKATIEPAPKPRKKGRKSSKRKETEERTSEPVSELQSADDEDETLRAKRETREQNLAAVAASKMEVKRIAAPVAEIAMLTGDSYGRKPRKDRRAAPIDVPATMEERMKLLQRLAADKRRSVRKHEGQDIDIFCQQVHTAFSAAMRDERYQGEEKEWSKLLYRIRGGIMTQRYSADYLYRFLDATVEMYKLEI